MHMLAYTYVARVLAAHPLTLPCRVVEIGARDINGSIRGLFDGARYLATDLHPGPGVDIVSDGATLELPRPVDVVVCCEVLEHAVNADRIVANMGRMLRPGGRLIVTAAGHGAGWTREPYSAAWARAPHSAVDGCAIREGEHYANISAATLTAWLTDAGCTDIEVETDHAAGDVYATATREAHA